MNTNRFLHAIAALALTLLAALSAFGEDAASARGFNPNSLYHYGDVDNINLFNGALTLTLPLGPTYPVGGTISYGLWFVFIGWFLLDAARSSYLQVETIEHLKGVRVADVMSRDWPVIDADLSLQQFVDDYLLRTGRRCFVVQADGAPAGLITPHEAKDVDRARWPQTKLRDVMVPLDRLHSMPPTAPLTDALERMGREDVNQLFIVSNRHVDGVLSRGDILRLLQTRVELGR